MNENMEDKKLCPILTGGYLGGAQTRYSLIEYRDQCTCKEDCAWYDENPAEKCRFINSLSMIATVAERS